MIQTANAQDVLLQKSIQTLKRRFELLTRSPRAGASMPHQIDAFALRGDRIIPLVSMIGSNLSRMVDHVAAFGPDAVMVQTTMTYQGVVTGQSSNARMFITAFKGQQTILAGRMGYDITEQQDGSVTTTYESKVWPVDEKALPTPVCAMVQRALEPSSHTAASVIDSVTDESIGFLIYPGVDPDLVSAALSKGWHNAHQGCAMNTSPHTDEQVRRHSLALLAADLTDASYDAVVASLDGSKEVAAH